MLPLARPKHGIIYGGMALVTASRSTGKAGPRLNDADKALMLWLLATNQSDDEIIGKLAQWGTRVTKEQIKRYRERHGNRIQALSKYLNMRVPNGSLATSQQRFEKLQEIADDVERRMRYSDDKDYASLLAKYLTVIKQIGDEVGDQPETEAAQAEQQRPRITLADMLAEGETLDEDTERDLFRALRRAEAALSQINGGGSEDKPDMAGGS